MFRGRQKSSKKDSLISLQTAHHHDQYSDSHARQIACHKADESTAHLGVRDFFSTAIVLTIGFDHSASSRRVNPAPIQEGDDSLNHISDSLEVSAIPENHRHFS